MLRRCPGRADGARRLLSFHRTEHEHPGRIHGTRGRRADLVHRPDAAGLDERIRRTRSDVRVLFHAFGPSARIGASRLLRGRRPDHAVLAVGRTDLPHQEAPGTPQPVERPLAPAGLARRYDSVNQLITAGLDAELNRSYSRVSRSPQHLSTHWLQT